MIKKYLNNCNHKGHVKKEYVNGHIKFYCGVCGIEIEDKPIRPIKPSNKAKNIYLKRIHNIKRKDTFICWSCGGAYINKNRNALGISKICPECRKKRRYDKHVDSFISDYQYLKRVLKFKDAYVNFGTNNDDRESDKYNFNLFRQYTENDSEWGLGQFLLTKPVKQGYDLTTDVATATPLNLYKLREFRQISKAIEFANKSWIPSNKPTKIVSRTPNYRFIKKGGKYYVYYKEGVNKSSGLFNIRIAKVKINNIRYSKIKGGKYNRKLSIPLTYKKSYINWKKQLYGSSYEININYI